MIFLALSLAVRGYAAQAEPSDTNMIPRNLPLWSESMLWSEQVSVFSGSGYNNNVLLSAFNPRGSGFFLNGLDLAAFRIPLDDWKVEAGVTGDDMRYWRTVGPASGEDLFLASGRVEREFSGGWRAGLETRGLYENQVLDTSTSSGAPTTALVQGFNIAARPYLCKNLTPALWLQFEIPVTRWYLKAPQDNYWDFGPIVTLGYNFGSNADITLSYEDSYQFHDTWVALDELGLFSTGKLLRIQQDQAELTWHQYWDAPHHWRSSTGLIFVYREDNGGGFFNFYQYQIIEDLLWRTASWEVKGGAHAAYEFYPVQSNGIVAGPNLERTLLNFTVNVERRIFRNLRFFTRLQYQRTISNEALGAGSYNGTTGSGGLRLEF